ncbi:MAG: CocE/NonD family hydrolase [Pirellulaceae bacterium]
MMWHLSHLELTSHFPSQTVRLMLCGILLVVCRASLAQRSDVLRESYVKAEHRIPMRDGVHLFTAVYTPADASAEKTYPMLMMRTCYSVGPYGADAFPGSLGPNRELQRAGYIFVYQDVRGCYMSEGVFKDMTPHIADKQGPQDVDESTDTYDTIDWLVANVQHHSSRVGQWGISYPGFYAAAGMIDAHPALKAVSPQAPIADWWYDDFHHHGALFLPHSFNFIVRFGQPRPKPTTYSAAQFSHGTPDGYQFFKDLGPLSNANQQYMRDRVPMWNDLVEHPNYDQYWQSRNLLPHLKRVAPAVLIVGGWFDAEDLYGPLQIYRRIEAENPGITNNLVMGPWSHGGWSRGRGDHLGNIDFEANTAEYFRKRIETVFFQTHLKENGQSTLPEATVFETGANRWRQFDQWPPEETKRRSLFFHPGERLTFDAPVETGAMHDEFLSDPDKPVPFLEDIDIGMNYSYMTDDQRFAARRPDVLVYQTSVLEKDTTLCGPLVATLHVSTSQSDADWIVKLVDVFPSDTKDSRFMQAGQHMGSYQMMVRSEVMRGRFRDDPSQPKPFVANEPTKVTLPLQDVLHTFAKGHRIMIQVQSTWFPLVDRNPQKYVDNIFLAKPEDFVKATHRVYRSAELPSSVEIGVLEE